MTKTRCEICDRNFKNEESLEMHNNAIHKKEEKPKTSTNKNIKGWTIFIIIIVLIGGGIFWAVSATVTAGSEYTEFAQCLTDSGVKMYGAFWCSACESQKAQFGKSFKKIDYFECSLPDRSQNAECNAEGIASYPTWEFADGSKQAGVLPFEQLSQLTGCQLPDN